MPRCRNQLSARFTLGALLIAFASLVGAAEESPAPAEWQPDLDSWLVFASATCEECEWLKTEFLPELETRFGDRVPAIAFVDIDDLDNYALLLESETAVGGSSGEEFPAFLVGATFRYGKDAIADWGAALTEGIPKPRLPEEVVRIVSKARDVTFYADEFTASSKPPGDEEPKPAAAPETPKLKDGEVEAHPDAVVLYFETTGCKKCARAEKQLTYALTKVSFRPVCRIKTAVPDARALQYAVTSRLELPSSHRLVTPMFVSGERALFGKDITDAALLELLEHAPAKAFWRSWNEEEELASARAELGNLAAGFTLSTVLVAGLIDGVNPCAFAVIVFLVSYLTLTGRLGRKFALIYGLTFSAGVFMCYFLIGLGFFRFLDLLESWQSAMRWMFIVMGVVCVAFGIGGIVDTVTAMKHGASKMKFGMPKALHRVVHRLIREDVSRGALGLGAFVIGIAVSGIELVCTGQIYLPVIVFINTSSPGGRSLGLLTLYNLAFIAPLIVVVILGAAGLGSDALSKWARRHAVLTRALTCLLVFGLAGIMFYMATRA